MLDQQKEKAFWKSKTLWVNVLIIGGAFLTELSSLLGTEGTISLFAIINIFLRVITKSEIKLT